MASVIHRQDVVVDGAPGGVVADTFVGRAAPGPLVTESVGFGEGPVVDVGVGSIGPEFGPGIGPVAGPGRGPGIDSELYYPDGPGFGDGPDGGGDFGLGVGVGGGDFGLGGGVGGRRSDLVSIRHSERVVPVPLPGGGPLYGGGHFHGGGPLHGGYVDGHYRDGYVDGPYPDEYLDGPGYIDGEFGYAGLVGGGGSGFAGGSEFDNGLSGFGLGGELGGRFETVGGGGGGGGGNAGVFYQETRNALPLQVTGTVRGEYVRVR